MSDWLVVPERHRAGRPRWLGALASRLFRHSGWGIEGQVPAEAKLILVVGPHTSNWDFAVGVTAMLALDLRIHWIGKHTLFRQPFRGLMIWLGGIPVNRSSPEGFATQIARRLREVDHMMIAITPEGTRSRVDRLKTGFSRIAREARCPILPVTLDYRRRVITLHDPVVASSDPEGDAADIRALFAGAAPRNADNF